jgi:PTH1 family peptidyl-tRNA hydrolase
VDRRAIFGLGNPGARYEKTLHNVGFLAVDALCAETAPGPSIPGIDAAWARLPMSGSAEVFVARPLSFMNRSGVPIGDLLEIWEVEPEHTLVVHDDVDLDPGRLKLKRGGGAGGHRGLLSIEECLGTREFCRLRVGVGRPPAGEDTAEYVLTPLMGEALEILLESGEQAARGARDWLSLDFQAAQKKVNTRPSPAVESPATSC